MRVLIIGKNNSQVSEASLIANSQGAAVTHCQDIESALSLLLSGKGADLILIDVLMDVAVLINRLKLDRIFVPVVGYGINATSTDAVRAIKAGAREYIPMPPDRELIAAILQSIAEESSAIIGSSPAMKQIMSMADRIAPSDASVLITGESGTGKEVIARYIHKKSSRAKENFVSVNCAAIPDNLLESELFGHEKGAFTGATNRRVGKFEESNNGTLLLDEISEMDARLQAKLLRAIQEREIDRVGGTAPVKLNLRILATSNRDLRKEVEKGSFREDLLFRLNVIHLNLPSLRERKEDIKSFAEYFIKKYSEANKIPVKPISSSALSKMESYKWPGNVRELENTMHRAVLLASGDVIDENSIMLSSEYGAAEEKSSIAAESGNGGALVGRTIESVERDLIMNTLDHCLGNRTHAANILGISIRTLRNKLSEYGKVDG